MAASGSVGVILPTTAYILRLRPPPVRDMIRLSLVTNYSNYLTIFIVGTE